MRKLLPLLGGVVGLVIILAYLNFAFGWVMLSQRLSLLLALAIGPVAAIGTLSLSEDLSKFFDRPTIRVGSVFLVVSFAILTLMITMQQAIFAEYRQLLDASGTAESTAPLKEAFSLVNHVQLGADVAFDIFYSIGVVFISSALVRGSGLERLIGTYGLVVGASLLALNIWYFPKPPAEMGSIDLGPATIVWWVALFVLSAQLDKRENPDDV